ncbi:MAG: hypothetical protein ACYYK0_05865 [Candidatus Eutrophobiaceae bacterium]
MPDFSQLLKANPASLRSFFYSLDLGSEEDMIKRTNLAAKQLQLNHCQLICGLGFNQHVLAMEEENLHLLGFREFRLFELRLRELFTTDIYKQLSIDNILDIYSRRSKDPSVERYIAQWLHDRLKNLQKSTKLLENPATSTSYKMEIHSLYAGRILPPDLAQQRLNDINLSPFRELSREALTAVENEYFPAANLFFANSLSPEEKELLIEHHLISKDAIKNRMQNKRISLPERHMLENHL